MSWHATGALAAGLKRIGPRSEPESATPEIFELGDRFLVGALERFEETRHLRLAEQDSRPADPRTRRRVHDADLTSRGRFGIGAVHSNRSCREAEAQVSVTIAGEA
jgi:hypothetical protein